MLNLKSVLKTRQAHPETHGVHVYVPRLSRVFSPRQYFGLRFDRVSRVHVAKYGHIDGYLQMEKIC